MMRMNKLSVQWVDQAARGLTPGGKPVALPGGGSQAPPGHAERSEASRRPSRETLRCAQGDTRGMEGDPSLRSG